MKVDKSGINDSLNDDLNEKSIKTPKQDADVKQVPTKKYHIFNEFNKKYKKWFYLGIGSLILALIGFLIVILWNPMFDDAFHKYANEIKKLAKEMSV